MANTDLPNGFKAVDFIYRPKLWPVAGSAAIAKGDIVVIDSNGRIALATTSSTQVVGVAASSVAATAAAGDSIWVYDNPAQHFEAQCSGNGALADPYTTRSSAACFDMEGTTGIMEIDENDNTTDLIKILGVGKDPITGQESAVGANQRKICMFNPLFHMFGTIA